MEASRKLVAYQAENRERTVAKVREAMRVIEAEVAAAGLYLHNGGRITRNEVYRRAGTGISTLKNRTHRQTAEIVSRWLKRLGRAAPAAKTVAKGRSARISELMQMIDSLAFNYDRFKVEFDKIADQNAGLEKENCSLRARIAELERDAALLTGSSNVVPLHRP